VFFESPKRILATLEILSARFPDAELCLCNDLTKKYERIYRGCPADVLGGLRGNEHAEKGEYTCVFRHTREGVERREDDFSVEARLVDIIVKSDGALSVKDAVEQLAGALGLPKKEIYAASLRLKGLF
jgi:16S rRNA (cytidine1402-2'-O)-methyltransferase